MRRPYFKITKPCALNIVFMLLAVMMLYHFLIIFQVVPYEMVWAGRLNSVEEMLQYEAFSIFVVVVIAVVFLLKSRHVAQGREQRATNVLLWVIAAFFGLNTIGNLFSTTTAELIFGTAVTLTLCGLTVFIARKKNI